ncbi:phosphate acetyltransferase [Solobacterium moorei]|uniref:Phosphate acetyltransferase n=1 Tax=Solobacterium moorei TaxID=102148 RepID=A0A412PAR3_9FIRM|nr:phosphate acetyltransferase [Solobacterium moorei]RGT53709.1 phosphate acetyltransferase [Solobacterium moorei]
MSFINGIKERAKQDIKTIVLPESEDERTLRAAAKILEEKTANLILIGEEATIKADAEKYGVNIDGATIINPETSDKLEEYVNTLYELRKAKGMTPEAAREALLKDRTTFGVMVLKTGGADGLVSGACHSTANTLRPALQILRTAPGAKLVSGFFIMDVPNCEFGYNGTFAFADCGLNQDPDSESLAAIANDTANTFRTLVGAEPKVAFLSHSTKGSAKHPLVDKVVNAVEIAHQQYPDLVCDGELQLDAAIVPSVAASKAPGSPVAGQANVLIFPNLDGGNIGYKLVQRLAKAEAYGPMLQGIAKPVNDLSRGCSWEDIVGVVALTAVQAQNSK